MQYLVDYGRRVGLLLGDEGTGKSVLLAQFARQLQQRGASVALVSALGTTERDLLWQIAADWRLAPQASDGGAALWCRVRDHVIENRLQKRASIPLVDNADHASGEVRQQIVRLAQCDLSAETRLTLIPATRPLSVAKLGERLLELATLRIDLVPWEEADTATFLTACIRNADGTRSPWSDTAIARLHDLADGTPRRICQLADLALLAGASQQLEVIDAATINAVAEELYAVET